MRLIDADALKSKVRAQEWKRDPAVMLALDWIYMLINEQPTIDAVPVVRCGECRYRELAKVNCKGYTICPVSGMEITDDDFCSYGCTILKR